MATKQFPEWARILYRGVRVAVAAAISQLVIGVCGQMFTSQGDVLACAPAIFERFKNPTAFLQFVGISLASGFIVSFGMWLRDILDQQFGLDEKSIVAKTMPI